MLFVLKITEIGGRTIMAAINDLRARIDILHVTITKIYTATCSPVETPDNLIGIPTLPLISMRELNNYENFLSQEENKLMMVKDILFLITFRKHSLQCIFFFLLSCVTGWTFSRTWQRRS